MLAIREILPGVLSNLKTPIGSVRGQLVDQWPSIVSPKIAMHTRPTLAPSGELCVWVDQATLAFELNQKYRTTILKRTQAALGEDAVKSIRFRIGQLRSFK